LDLAEPLPEPLPWVYEYQEDLREPFDFLHKPLLRPAVWVRLRNGREQTETHRALVDSGCDHILAPDWIAHSIGVEPDRQREMEIRIGGATRKVRFADVAVELYPPGTDPTRTDGLAGVPRTWDAQVGFFMGWTDPPWLVLLESMWVLRRVHGQYESTRTTRRDLRTGRLR
jgi:hypothetical protein